MISELKGSLICIYREDKVHLHIAGKSGKQVFSLFLVFLWLSLETNGRLNSSKPRKTDGNDDDNYQRDSEHHKNAWREQLVFCKDRSAYFSLWSTALEDASLAHAGRLRVQSFRFTNHLTCNITYHLFGCA